jgi:hypothetical protein
LQLHSPEQHSCPKCSCMRLQAHLLKNSMSLLMCRHA